MYTVVVKTWRKPAGPRRLGCWDLEILNQIDTGGSCGPDRRFDQPLPPAVVAIASAPKHAR